MLFFIYLGPYQKNKRKSIILDHGKEFPKHREVTKKLDEIPFYFADTHASWQRGTNENTNGLLKTYFPKTEDLTNHSADYIEACIEKLNKRSYKCLGMILNQMHNTKVENTSEDTIGFYPDQATLVTDTKEQVQANMFYSDLIGGDFIGKVEKEGVVLFELEKDISKLKNIKIVIDGPHDDNFEKVGKGITKEFNLLEK